MAVVIGNDEALPIGRIGDPITGGEDRAGPWPENAAQARAVAAAYRLDQGGGGRVRRLEGLLGPGGRCRRESEGRPRHEQENEPMGRWPWPCH